MNIGDVVMVVSCSSEYHNMIGTIIQIDANYYRVHFKTQARLLAIWFAEFSLEVLIPINTK